MADEPRDATPEEIAQENALRHFEAQVAFRQSNILPMDSVLNLGMFYGLLIRASRPRNGIERLGFILMGLSWVVSGSPLFTPLGFKLLWTAPRRAEREPAEIAPKSDDV